MPRSISLASRGARPVVNSPPTVRRFSNEARTLQWLDRRVGAPVCLLLTLLRRIGGADAGEAPVGSILFLKLAEQGSTVLAHEAVRLACGRVGRENVHFMVFEENRFIVDVIGLVPPGNVHTVRTASAWAMVASGAAAIRRLRGCGSTPASTWSSSPGSRPRSPT